MTVDPAATFEDSCDATTPTDVWPILMRAWLNRRRDPLSWRVFAGHAILENKWAGKRPRSGRVRVTDLAEARGRRRKGEPA